jgi:hypothetical protein
MIGDSIRSKAGHAPGLRSGQALGPSSRGWGGPRPNSGGARANSGGARPGAGRKSHPARQITEPGADPLHWYCVRTHWKAEITADRELREKDFTVFSPSIWLPAIKAWRNANGATRAAMPQRVEPMFPRYIFTRFSLGSDDWKRIRRLSGVDYLFASPSGIRA